MDTLFSNIQPILQKHDKENLLNDQIINNNRLNDLLEQGSNNYYKYTNKPIIEDNKLEDDLNNKAQELVDKLSELFKEDFSSAVIINQELNNALLNASHTEDILNEYMEKNEKLNVMLMDNRDDILTNDRKTYYETQELDRLKLWYKIWFSVYYVLVFTFLICWIMASTMVSWKIRAILSILIIFYPYYIDHILRRIYRFIMGIYKNLPKNVYNNL